MGLRCAFNVPERVKSRNRTRSQLHSESLRQNSAVVIWRVLEEDVPVQLQSKTNKPRSETMSNVHRILTAMLPLFFLSCSVLCFAEPGGKQVISLNGDWEFR
jgi:hypothetical protein